VVFFSVTCDFGRKVLLLEKGSKNKYTPARLRDTYVLFLSNLMCKF
jgi:hypothetical protein